MLELKLKGIGSIGTTTTIFMLFIGFCCSVYLGFTVAQNYKIKLIKKECEILDKALENYSFTQANIAKTKQNINDNKNNSIRNYPKDLNTLGIIRYKHYFISDIIDLSKFRYETHTDSAQGMTYTLGVHLPNGYYYKSPNSQK